MDRTREIAPAKMYLATLAMAPSSNVWMDVNVSTFPKSAMAFTTAEISAMKMLPAHRTTPLASNISSVVPIALNVSKDPGFAMVHLTVPTNPTSRQHVNSSPARVAISGAKTSGVYLANSTVTITMTAEITRTRKTVANTAVLQACGRALTLASASPRTNSATENLTVRMEPTRRHALTTCAQVLAVKQGVIRRLREASVPAHKAIDSTNVSSGPAQTSTSARSSVTATKTVRTIDLGLPALAWALATDLK
jgi:hypothetical protein